MTKRWGRRLLWMGLGLAAAGALVYVLWPQPVEVDLAAVERGPLQVTVDEDGRTRIRERYVVSSPLGGRLRRIRLRPGDAVYEAQTVLAVIEPTAPALLDARARAEAEARVRAAEAAVERNGPEVETALAALQFAESDLDRVRRLAARGTATQHDLEAAELRFRTRSQEYRSARFSEDIARFELDQARAALIRTQAAGEASSSGREAGDLNPDEAEAQFEIPSPIGGQVLRVFQESERVVSSGDQLLELGDPADLEVEIDVLSSDAVRISPGNRVVLEHWGGDEPLEATVRQIEPSAFTKVSALGVEEQRVNVIADLLTPPEERPGLADGFRVEARIVAWEHPDVLKVPVSALFRVGEDWAAFVVENDHAVVRTVRIGRRTGLEAEVLAGLRAGERVVIHPGDRVRDGARVVSRGES